MCGLPLDVSAQLRASDRIKELNLAQVAEKARVLMDERVHGGMAVVRAESTGGGGATLLKSAAGSGRRGAAGGGTVGSFQRMVCFECGGNHPVRFCKERTVTCWKCEEPGHLSRHCPASGNGGGKLSAPAVFRDC